jgi:Fur family ferric uptake transcriptional regulator
MRSSSVETFILDTLTKKEEHLTSQQVFEEIRAHLPAVNPSTVYRALERLVHQGKVSVADIGAGAMVYELVTDEHHHHIVCQECGHTMTISDRDVQEFFAKIASVNRFQIVTNHLILFGLCQDCRKVVDGQENKPPG